MLQHATFSHLTSSLPQISPLYCIVLYKDFIPLGVGECPLETTCIPRPTYRWIEACSTFVMFVSQFLMRFFLPSEAFFRAENAPKPTVFGQGLAPDPTEGAYEVTTLSQGTFPLHFPSTTLLPPLAMPMGSLVASWPPIQNTNSWLGLYR